MCLRTEKGSSFSLSRFKSVCEDLINHYTQKQEKANCSIASCIFYVSRRCPADVICPGKNMHIRSTTQFTVRDFIDLKLVSDRQLLTFLSEILVILFRIMAHYGK